MKATLLAAAVKVLAGAQVRWIDCEPDVKQRVYFANHTSNLDTLLLWAALPVEIRALTRPAAAHDYWTAGKIRLYLASQVFQAILIERLNITKSNNPLDLILREMGNLYSLILFPEGKRNPGPEVGNFKSGLYHIGKNRPDLEFVPVYIQNLNRILPKGEFLPVPLLTSVTFGRPIRVEPSETKASFMQRARDAVVALGPS